MERGSDKHGPARDDLRPPADDDPPRRDIAAGPEPDADERMARLRHDLDVANDSRYEDRDLPGAPDG